MDRHYSTLELAKHDETARAPERDYDTTAFELDTSALAPETAPDTTPEALYDSTLPETHGNVKPTKEHLQVTKLAHKRPWIVMALILAAAIVVGVSVGIWHDREHTFRRSPKVSSPPAPPNSDITSQNILNDTSLVALLLSNGDRVLFFQDNTGLLRRAVRTNSNGQWITSQNLNASTNLPPGPSSNPKKYTPLTAIGPTCGLNVVAKFQKRTSNLPSARTLTSTQISISLYYVSENNTVSSNVLVLNDSWIPNPGFGPEFGSYSTAIDTRSLSIKRIVYDSRLSMNSTTNCALLYYENPSGNVSALLNRVSVRPNPNSGLGLQFQWIDVTSQESEALPREFWNAPDYNYSKTFSHTLYESDPYTVYGTPFSSDGGLFYSPSNPLPSTASPLAGGRIFWMGYKIGTSGPGNFTQVESISPSGDLHSIHQSDIALFGSDVYGIWINGTQPVLVTFSGDGTPPLPSNEFPFTRLASISTAGITTSDGITTTYLYHQMNGTTFAEEEWDDGLRAWSSTEYITVTDT